MYAFLSCFEEVPVLTERGHSHQIAYLLKHSDTFKLTACTVTFQITGKINHRISVYQDLYKNKLLRSDTPVGDTPV